LFVFVPSKHAIRPREMVNRLIYILTVRPEIEIEKTASSFETGMIINCTLKRDNLPHVNFTWESCDRVNCSKTNAWKLESRDQFLRIDDQEKFEVKYRCTARSVVGEDISPIIKIYRKPDATAKSITATSVKTVKSTKNTSLKTMLFVVVPIGTVTIIVVMAMCFVLCKRKKIYGGFYIFSYPPLPDYMERMDVNGNIQEQLQKLPFLPEWEFPRERISFSK
jgi:hypothetical protein